MPEPRVSYWQHGERKPVITIDLLKCQTCGGNEYIRDMGRDLYEVWKTRRCISTCATTGIQSAMAGRPVLKSSGSKDHQAVYISPEDGKSIFCKKCGHDVSKTVADICINFGFI